MKAEEWRPIKDWPNYEVSNIGRVRVLRNGELVILYSRIYSGGYRLVSLNRNEVWKTAQVSRLVATAFIGDPFQGAVIDHINNKRSDNRVKNLRWLTVRENVLRGNAPSAKNLRKTKCKRGHPLSGENLLKYMLPIRTCRKCVSFRAKRWKNKQKLLKERA